MIEHSFRLFDQRKWLLIFFSLFILYLIFSPAIHILHYSGDDFKYSFGGISKSCAENDDYHFLLTTGRPLQTFVDCLGFKFGYTLEGMRTIRLLTVITMGMVMGLLADYLCTLGLSFWVSFFASGCLLLIAHLYGDAIPMGSIALPFALLMALMGYRAINRFYSHTKKWLVLSFICILAALLTYPALAFFFITLMLMKFLTHMSLRVGDQTDLVRSRIKQELFIEFFVFVTACLVYFAWAYYNIRYHARTEIPAAYQVDQPNFNVLEMFNRLILLGNIFSSWWPLSPRMNIEWQGWIMVIGLLGIIVKQTKIFFIAMGILIINSGFFLIMPNLNVVENRVLYPIIVSSLVLVFSGFWQWKNILPEPWGKRLILLGLIALFLSLGKQAGLVTMANAISHVEYLHHTQESLAEYLQTGQELKRIHFIIPQSNSPYDRYTHTQAALTPLMKGKKFRLRWCAQSSLGNNHTEEAIHCLASMKNSDIAVTYSFEGEPFIQTNGMTIVQNNFKSLSIV